MPASDSKFLVERFLAGDQEAAQLIFTRYFGRMSQLARKRMSQKIQSRCDAQDVAQAALSTFFELVPKKHFAMDGESDLWRLLAAITVHKANQQIQYHRAAKRSVDKETNLRKAPNSISPQDQPSQATSVENTLALADEVESLVHILDPVEWQVLQLRLQELSSTEIATFLNCSTRTVRRLSALIRAKLSAAFNKIDPTVR